LLSKVEPARMTARYYTPVDTLLINLDQAIRTLFGRPATTGRPNPAAGAPATDELQPDERQLAARLMRVNHAGEVCAQALYQGQALTARRDAVRDRLEQVAVEENDHLAWCEARLKELDSHVSVLNPLFYAGSFAIGALAGQAGDRWSLGFVAETEHQVVEHLNSHLNRLPAHDRRDRAILEQMKEDEARHATQALAAGGARLPPPFRLLMKGASKVMTGTAYWL
jgi:ubiquinone biosynthesis monooxygenase Coq7